MGTNGCPQRRDRGVAARSAPVTAGDADNSGDAWGRLRQIPGSLVPEGTERRTDPTQVTARSDIRRRLTGLARAGALRLVQETDKPIAQVAGIWASKRGRWATGRTLTGAAVVRLTVR